MGTEGPAVYDKYTKPIDSLTDVLQGSVEKAKVAEGFVNQHVGDGFELNKGAASLKSCNGVRMACVVIWEAQNKKS